MNNLTIAALCASASTIILSAGVIHSNIRKIAAQKAQEKPAPTPTPLPLIGPAPVARDEDGHWWHPGMPEFDEGEDDKFNNWKRQQGLETTLVHMESDLDDDHPTMVSYYDLCDPNCSGWEPTPPAGDGWFTLFICDTEDGPLWVWARRQGGAA
jgi:hypothetical protein